MSWHLVEPFAQAARGRHSSSRVSFLRFLPFSAPRTASIVANSPSILWALDRITFRTILLDHTSSKRKMHESFLSSIKILEGLEPYERAKIADALETRTYEEGKTVIVEGEIGEDFFLIESGRAEFTKKTRQLDGSTTELVVAEFGKGEYFGGESTGSAFAPRLAEGDGRS